MSESSYHGEPPKQKNLDKIKTSLSVAYIKFDKDTKPRCNILFIEERYSKTLHSDSYFFQCKNANFWLMMKESGILEKKPVSGINYSNADEVLFENQILALGTTCLNTNIDAKVRDAVLESFMDEVDSIIAQACPRIVCFLSIRLYFAYNRIQYEQQNVFHSAKLLNGLQDKITGDDSYVFVLPIQRSYLANESVFQMMKTMKEILRGRIVTESPYHLLQTSMTKTAHSAMYVVEQFQKRLGPTASLEDVKRTILQGGSEVENNLLYLMCTKSDSRV